MIDPTTEHLISLAAVAESLPARRRGKRPHISCIYRWTQVGCRGVILESIQVGGTRCTSKEALARFFRRLSKPRRSAAIRLPRRRDSTAPRHRSAAVAAGQQLEREGL